MNKPVIVVGAGGHARVLVGILREQGVPIQAIVAPQVGLAPEFESIPRLSCDGDVLSLGVDKIELVNAIGSLPDQTQARLNVHKFFSGSGYKFKTVISGSATVSGFSELAQGVQIMPGAILNSCVVGESTIVNTGAIIEHDVQIGADCHIAPGAVVCGSVNIGSRVHIGANATVIQGITIGDHAVVAAGSVVTKDLPGGSAHYPARAFIKKGRYKNEL